MLNKDVQRTIFKPKQNRNKLVETCKSHMMTESHWSGSLEVMLSGDAALDAAAALWLSTRTATLLL